jgi:hypothetical protein
MLLRIALATFVTFGVSTAVAADPYAALSRLEGAELKRAVSGIAARGHRPLNYRALWDVLKAADRHPSLTLQMPCA